MKKIYLLAALTFALTACDSNDDTTSPVTSSQVPLRVFASIGESVTSRAVDTEWTAGDRIGITVTVGEDANPNNNTLTPHINVPYTATDGGSESEFTGAPLFFYWPMVVTAYYPYAAGTEENATPNDSGIITITADTDTDNQSAANQPKIDFLFATGKTGLNSNGDPQVDFAFAHKMSKLTFAFVGTKEVKDEEQGIYIPKADVSDMVSYEIEGLVLDGTFDTATGVCAVENDAEAQNLKIDLTNVSVSDGVSLAPLIVFPQKPGNSNVKLHVYTNELDNESVLQHYICPLTFGEGGLKPGNNYNYTVKITKFGLVLQKMKIEDWNLARDVKLTATIDGGWKPDEEQQ